MKFKKKLLENLVLNKSTSRPDLDPKQQILKLFFCDKSSDYPMPPSNISIRYFALVKFTFRPQTVFFHNS